MSEKSKVNPWTAAKPIAYQLYIDGEITDEMIENGSMRLFIDPVKSLKLSLLIDSNQIFAV